VYHITRYSNDNFTKVRNAQMIWLHDYFNPKAWVNSWIELIEELGEYVEKYHRNGLQWNRQ
jgi:hypothetical protein